MSRPVTFGAVTAALPTTAVSDAVAWVRGWQQRSKIPGVAFVVTDATSTAVVELSGVTDVVTRRPAAAEHRWQIGSISKAFTAMALLQLQSAGRLSLDDPLVKHLPWATEVRPDVTLHHLLTHTGGLPVGSEWSTDSRLETALLGLLGNPQPPGSGYHYSNSGYEALGDVVETVTGEPLESYLERAVLHPLGMVSAAASVKPQDRSHDVRGHRPPRDDVIWRADTEQVPDQWFPFCTADGAIVANAEDVAHYLRFLIRGQGDGVLTAEQFEQLSARHVQVDDDSWYGYGLRTRVGPMGTTVGHGGSMIGLYADVAVDRGLGIGTALMINGHGDVWEANHYLLDRLRAAITPALVAIETEVTYTAVLDDPAGPPQWEAMVGLYRAYNPWWPTAEVVRDGDALYLCDPVSGVRKLLTALEGTRFRVGLVHSPEVAAFDIPVEGAYQRLDVSGCGYARVRRRSR